MSNEILTYKIVTLTVSILSIVIISLAATIWIPYDEADKWATASKVSMITFVTISSFIFTLVILLLSEDKLKSLSKGVYYPPRIMFNNKFNNMVNLLLSPLYFVLQLIFFVLYITLMVVFLLANSITLLIFSGIINYKNGVIGSEKIAAKTKVENSSTIFGKEMKIGLPSWLFNMNNSMIDIQLSPFYFSIHLAILILLLTILPFYLITAPIITAITNK